MIKNLKNIKYYLLHHKILINGALFLKLIITFKIVRFYKKKFLCSGLGNFKSKIDLFNIEELKLLNDQNYIHSNLQSLRNFDFKNANLIINAKQELIKKFLRRNLKIKFFNFDKNLLNKKRIFFINEKKNFLFSSIKKDNIDILLSRYNLGEIKKFFKYDFESGRILKKDTLTDSYYKLYSKKKIYINNKKNIISGFSTLRTISLYPFDLAFESILPHVDEFVLGIDINKYKNQNKKSLNNFLNKTKYKNKIKIHFFDFKSDTTINMHNRFRWLVDANNKVLNHCNGEYCFYIQSDEFYNHKKINIKRAIKHNEDVLFNFKHYIFDLQTIINEKNTSYNKAIRIFKKDLYCSSHDAFNFEPLNESVRPNQLDNSNFEICHFNLIYKYKEKIDHHFVKNDGMHKNHVSKKEFYDKYLVPFNYENSLMHENLKKLNYLPSYRFFSKHIK
jgi:hypothetical protein